MKELEYWEEIQDIGVLNMEMELVVGVEPVLFVCSLEGNPERKYLVMTYNSLKGKYVIREINNKEILLMLDNEITMEQTFRNGTEIILTYLEDGLLKMQSYRSCDFDEAMLPKKGAYYNIHSRYILNYKKELKTQTFRFDSEDENYNTAMLEQNVTMWGNESKVRFNSKALIYKSCQQSTPYYVFNDDYVA